MGTFRTRVKKKGKRWIKGQSSNSNPSSKKFRQFAKNNFFKENLTVPPSVNPLTADSLRRHNDIMGESSSRTVDTDGKSSSGISYNDDQTYSSYQGTTKTFETFASDWSCCSNVSFNKLINRFDLSSAHHKEMLAVLAAVTEVIKANGGTENTTEYFAALVTTLESLKPEEATESSVSAILALLSMCIKSVPKGILQLKFSAVSKTIMEKLEHYATSDHNTILKSLIGCLKVLIFAQEAVVWNDSHTYVIFDAILTFIVHTKSKIRKAAQHAVCAILKGSPMLKNDTSIVSHPAASRTAKYCIQIVESSISIGGVTTVLHVLTLLREIISTFPEKQMRTSCETILKLMTVGNTLVTSCSLQTLHGLFISRPNVMNCPAELNARLITTLYSYQPPPTDTQPMLAWLAVMQEAFINLSKNDLNLCMLNTPKLFEKCTSALLSERKEVINNTALTMKAILKDCIGEAAKEENYEQYKEEIEKVFKELNNCLKYKYHATWKQVLFLIGVMYKACGKTCHGFMINCLKSLADLKESENFSYENEVEQVFAFAIETIGPQRIIKEVPLQVVEKGNGFFEIKRSWLLPLFKDNIKNSSLKCFIDCFLPIATFFKKESEKPNINQARVITYELLQSQLWALLPSFCDNPSDLAETFPTIAKPLGDILDKRKELRMIILASLRKLISTCRKEDESVLSRFAKNYLPIIFNLYTTQPKGTDEEGIRFSAFETIKSYISITDVSILEDLFKRALQKLKSEETGKSKFTKESLLDLIRILLPAQFEESLKLLFDQHISKILKTNNFKEEKKYYRLLEELCACESEGCTSFMKENVETIKHLLLQSLSKAAAPSRGPRIRCLIHLLNYDSSKETVFEYIPEAVLCCKDINKRCRTSAFELVRKMADKMLEQGEEHFEEFLNAVSAGLVGTPTMMAATILTLAYVIHYYKKNIDKEQIETTLNNVCLCAISATREIVGPALGFIKLFITAYEIPFVSVYLQLIVKTLSGVTDDCKRRYRQKMRDIYDRLVRKFGAVNIIALVPTHDGQTLTRLKALKKLNDRKRKRKEQQKQNVKDDSDDDDFMFNVKSKPKTIDEILAECDDDDELDENEEEKPVKSKSKKNEVYLREDDDAILDFTSATANRNITTVNPEEKQNVIIKQKKKEKTEFETAPDGRLIILEQKPEKLPARNEDSDEISIASDAEAEGALSNLLNDIVISRKRKFSSKDSENNEPPSKYKAGGSGIHRKVDKGSGLEYKAKKAKGDVKKKGMHEPYAYIQLTRNSLNKRKKKKAAGQFKNIVRSAKKGADKGNKNFKSKKRGKK